MRRIRNQTNLVVWHCSASPPSWDGHAADIATMHKAKGWDDIGYHLVISREGAVQWGEDPRKQGAHALGVNRTSIAVCMIGGVDESGDPNNWWKDAKPENNFTAEQWESARATFLFLNRVYPAAEHVGHRDLSPDLDRDGRIDFTEFMKACPCYSVKQWIDNDLQPVADLYAPWELSESEFEPEIDEEDYEELQDEYIEEEDEGYEDDG